MWLEALLRSNKSPLQKRFHALQGACFLGWLFLPVTTNTLKKAWMLQDHTTVSMVTTHYYIGQWSNVHTDSMRHLQTGNGLLLILTALDNFWLTRGNFWQSKEILLDFSRPGLVDQEWFQYSAQCIFPYIFNCVEDGISHLSPLFNGQTAYSFLPLLLTIVSHFASYYSLIRL